MKLLVINSGSSSLKYTLFDMRDESELLSGVIDRLGLDGSTHTYRGRGERDTVTQVSVPDHGAALDEMLAVLSGRPEGSLKEISAVAHRVGHGGRYKHAVRITTEVMQEIQRMTPMIPLHHPAMIREIEECERRMPDAEHVAVFDTWFHETIPDKAAVYGLPYRYFEQKGYRRTGFHGNSHAYVPAAVADYLGTAQSELKIVSCHLGSGASICAIDGGKSIDTTLGMTALPGLIMSTRCGDVDPGLIPIIMSEESLTPDEMTDLLYRESGLKGISGVGRDLRDVQTAADRGDERARLAIEAFCYQVKRAIGAMLMALGGCDAIVFCGGIGCNQPMVRSKAVEGAEELGFVIDPDRNSEARPTEAAPVIDVSASRSRVKILVMKTNEEIVMARQCMSALELRNSPSMS